MTIGIVAGRGLAVSEAPGVRVVGFSAVRPRADHIARGPGGDYSQRMTSIGVTSARRAPASALRALGSARSWRATVHAVAGVPLGIGAGVAIGTLALFWSAAVWSLADGPTGAWFLPVTYVLVALGGPVLLPWLVRGCGAAQRARFRELLGIELPAPSRTAGGWLARLLRPWRSAGTWRQLAYHLLAVVVCGAGGALVAGCWLSVPLALGYAGWYWSGGGRGPGVLLAGTVLAAGALLAAPWVARGVTHADEVLARALLGPGRAEELALRVESLARSRAEIVAATDAERRRIERDLHDGAQQRLVALAMHLGMARATLTDASEPARQAIADAHDEALQALAELREFVRGLHPAVLNDRGLDAALSGIAARAPFPVRLRVEVATRCSPSIEAVAYFVVSEALTNVAKHARATSCEVTVERRGGTLRIAVRDDGAGGASEAGGGSGLRGLAQRAAAVDGTLEVDSPVGGPTMITVELPCES
jgi:signal transduction histidine kinase